MSFLTCIKPLFIGDPANRAINFSARAKIYNDEPIIAGFVLAGEAPTSLLFRVLGPSLTAVGLGTEVISWPKVTVLNSNNMTVATANGGNWDASLAAVAAAVGAFALAPGSLDAVMLITLQPGVYTVRAEPADTGNDPGLIMLEIYEVT